MNQEELAHAIRAACSLLNEPYVVVFGSQSLLGSHPESELPQEATLSIEVDITPGNAVQRNLPEPELNMKLLQINADLGENSTFHDSFGFYVEAIHRDTVALPRGWEGRLVRFTPLAEYGHIGYCLDPVDLCIAKIIAGREKDHTFIAALLDAGVVAASDILKRLAGEPIEWPSNEAAAAEGQAVDLSLV
ncbi:DUF6036 family nucleotidyltransferase [Nocardia sp. NPDC019395]|uniref:DUF6036 family nucleotidyltransferase n=1 Tax=Nocardia sp. NPDC019395 TaxID=3154686 RepID=UPI0033DA5CC0